MIIDEQLNKMIDEAEYHFPGLVGFVTESNRIEGMIRQPTAKELGAHIGLLNRESITIAAVEEFVADIGGKPLRDRPGMDVRVGPHRPPQGGPHIAVRLAHWIDRLNDNDGDPWTMHVEYETLHPFMDGNGRSGRALWAWQILRFHIWPDTLELGFLHPNYYAALQASRR